MAGSYLYSAGSTLCLASLPHAGASWLVLRTQERLATNTIAGKGSYILIIRLPEEQTITIGRRQTRLFPAGDYAYVGSALSGFKARLSHHLRPHKKPHWHIDYLLQRASIRSIILCESQDRTECTIARAISHHFAAIPGFGASDCRCQSHLFGAADGMPEAITTLLNSLGFIPRVVR